MSSMARKLKRALLHRMYADDRNLTPESKLYVNTQRQKLMIQRNMQRNLAQKKATAVEQKKGR